MIAGVNGLYWLLAVLVSSAVTIWYYWWFFEKYFKRRAGLSKTQLISENNWWFIAAFLRFTGVFLLSILLFNPWWVITKTKEIQPNFLVYVDSSLSMDSLELKRAEDWVNNGLKPISAVKIKQYSFSSEILTAGSDLAEGVKKGEKRNATSIAAVFDHLSQFQKHSPVSGALLISDGISNVGMDPDYITSPKDIPVFFIGTGDPKVYADLSVKSLLVNDEVLSDGVTPIEAQIVSKDFKGSFTAQLLVDNQVVANKVVVVSQSRESQKVSFDWVKKMPGRYNLSVQVLPLKNEKNSFNNRSSKLVKVIENKKRILLIADFVDPDIAAMKRTLRNWDQFELILTNGLNWQKWETQSDIILIKGVNKGLNLNVLRKWQQGGKPIWFMVSGDEDVRLLSEMFGSISNQFVWQDVQCGWNNQYAGFTMDNRLSGRFDIYPPLQVPMLSMGNMGVNAIDVLLWQRWNGNLTKIPLHWIVRNSQWNSLMISLGKGFWRWRLAEYKEWSDFSAFDQWFRRSLLVLNAMVDKPSRLEIQLSKSMVDQSQMLLGRVVYREADGKINAEAKIDLQLRKHNQKSGESEPISLTRNDVGQDFFIDNLSSGEYRLSAKVNIGGEIFQDEEIVLVNEKPLELLDLTARHQWMKVKSNQTKGDFEVVGNLSGFEKRIVDKIQSAVLLKVEEKETYWWRLLSVLVAVVCLFGGEWALRKWLGKY